MSSPLQNHKAYGRLSVESELRVDDSGNGDVLDNFQMESRAVEQLSQEYRSVISATGTSTTTIMAPKVRGRPSSKPGGQKADGSRETMLEGMAPVLFLCQCFSLLGVSNAAGRDRNRPVFRWLSFRILYSAIVTALLLVNAILSLCDLVSTNELSLELPSAVAFYSGNFICSCLYVRLATRWESLCTAFEHLESRFRFYDNANGLRRRMRSLTALTLILALAEHSLLQLKIFIAMDQTTTGKSLRQWLEKYYEVQSGPMSVYIPFSPLSAFVGIVVNTAGTFIWNANDLFIMLMSIAISWRIRQLKTSLASTDHEDKDVQWWRHARENFNAVSSLTKTVNQSIGVHVLLSFVNNLYFICLQLLHTVRYDKYTVYTNIYFSYSFGFLLVRAAAVLLFAASIHEESRSLKQILYSVSTNNYCSELKRMLVQVTTDEVALTGYNLFYVTRSLLLTVVGTITTYEVVLVQFNTLR